MFEEVLDARDEPHERSDLAGSSDHFGFLQAGIPTGGLFAGATEDAGAAAPDPCYHIACDDLDNVDLERVVLFAEVTTAVIARLMAD